MRRTQARGDARRQLILEATLGLIARDGAACASHRAVAAAAGVPPTAVTYYFGSRGDLLRAALEHFVDGEVARLGALAAELEGCPPERVAARFSEALADHEPSLAQFELYLEASRRPRLREAAAACLKAYAGAAEAALSAGGAPRAAEGARVFVALADGLALARTAAPDVHDADTLARAMRDLFIAFAMDDDERAEWERRMSRPAAQRGRR